MYGMKMFLCTTQSKLNPKNCVDIAYFEAYPVTQNLVTKCTITELKRVFKYR